MFRGRIESWNLRDRHMTETLEGVIYAPKTERQSHYFRAVLPRQFDFVVHIDHTEAVEPFERIARLTDEDVEETFPTGL